VLNQIKVQGMTVCGAGLPPSLDFAQEASIQSALSEFRSGEKQLLLVRYIGWLYFEHPEESMFVNYLTL
jgi:hypothetical protein